MTTIAVNVRLFLAILCSLALICTFLLIATDTTDEKRDFVHYVMYILVFLLEIGMEVTIMLFVGGSMKSYTELCTLPTYEERLEYLQLHGEVGRDTFGFDRWLNQDFYKSREWRQFRDRIIARDMGCDLGCPDHPITDWVLRDGRPVRPRISIHHLNPITKEDVIRHSEKLLDPENAICVSAATHKAIHYGTGDGPKIPDGNRTAGDTCPWRK
jgi:hypothetical protein